MHHQKKCVNFWKTSPSRKLFACSYWRKQKLFTFLLTQLLKGELLKLVGVFPKYFFDIWFPNLGCFCTYLSKPRRNLTIFWNSYHIPYLSNLFWPRKEILRGKHDRKKGHTNYANFCRIYSSLQVLFLWYTQRSLEFYM